MLNHLPSADEDPHAIVSRRTIAATTATAAALWRALSDARALERWWGPAGFTVEIDEHDFRVGGRWHFTLRGPDGTAYPNRKHFVELEAPRRIVMRHEQAGHDFTMTIELEAVEGGTALTWVLRFDDLAEAEKLRAIILGANEQNFDRLEAHLAAG